MSSPIAAPAPAPLLSVIVAASDSARAVARTLDALARQRGAERVEVIVAAARDRVAAPPPRDPRSPCVRWVVAAPGTDVPRLRRLGLDRATAPLVVFTEDSCLFGPGWAAAWVAAFEDPCVRAATGTVEPAMGAAAIDWAVFFCEYAAFLPRTASDPGPVTRLAGNNFAVRRGGIGAAVLDRPAIHETEVAAASSSGGLVSVRQARAGHVRRYLPREAIGDRLRFGHAYGRLRAVSWPTGVRLAGLSAGPAILWVQASRLCLTMLARRRHLGSFLATLPITLGLLAAWSVGEWLGWLAAPRPPRPPAARRGRGRAAPPEGRPPARPGSRPGHCTAAPPAA